MEPSQKSEQVDNDITRLFGIDRRASIRGCLCTSCGQPASVFRDGLSRCEYSISGLCQACQDTVFSEPQDEEYEGDL